MQVARGRHRSVCNETQQQGRLIFFARGQRDTRHIGHNFNDGEFHNIGIGTGNRRL